jgi:hypothetical protein
MPLNDEMAGMAVNEVWRKIQRLRESLSYLVGFHGLPLIMKRLETAMKECTVLSP